MPEETPVDGQSCAARSMPWNRWVNAVIAISLVSVAVALVLPVIQQAREHARRARSKSTLKQIGMAFGNYHEVHEVFPPGGIVDSSGRGRHGWIYQLIPYLDQTSLFADIDENRPWNVDVNRHRYRHPMQCYRLPGISEVVTTDGFPVTHLMANPAIMFRNSSTRTRDFKDGLSNAWLIGEAGGDYQPWGYPFNWREITGPLNESTGSFGRPGEVGAYFLSGDGAVRFYSDALIEGERMPAGMFDHPPLPDPTLTARPLQKFDLTSQSGLPRQSIKYLEPADDFRSLAAETVTLADGTVDFLQIRGSYKTGFNQPTIEHLREAFAFYPNVRHILLPVPLDDDVASLLATLPDITNVYAESVTVSKNGVKLLCGIKPLRVLLVEKLDDESAEHFAACKPGFEIRRGRVQ